MIKQFGYALIALLILGCSNGVDMTPITGDCDRLAASMELNDQCAIEFAKKEIVTRQGAMRYSRFSASFNDSEKVWVVMAIYEPETPGGHVYVVVRRDGSIADYSLGM